MYQIRMFLRTFASLLAPLGLRQTGITRYLFLALCIFGRRYHHALRRFGYVNKKRERERVFGLSSASGFGPKAAYPDAVTIRHNMYIIS